MFQSLLHFFTVLLGSGQSQDGAVTGSASLVSSVTPVTNSSFNAINFLDTQANLTVLTTSSNLSFLDFQRTTGESFASTDQNERYSRTLKLNESQGESSSKAKEPEWGLHSKILRSEQSVGLNPPNTKEYIDRYDTRGLTKTQTFWSELESSTETPIHHDKSTKTPGPFSMKRVQTAFKSAVDSVKGIGEHLKNIPNQMSSQNIESEVKKLNPFRLKRMSFESDLTSATTPEPTGRNKRDDKFPTSHFNGQMLFYGGPEHDLRFHSQLAHSDGLMAKSFIPKHDHKDSRSIGEYGFDSVTGTFRSPSENEIIDHGRLQTPSSKIILLNSRFVGKNDLSKLNKGNQNGEFLSSKELDSFSRASTKKSLAIRKDHPQDHLDFASYLDHIHDYHHAVENTPTSYNSYDWTSILKSLTPSNNVKPPKTCTCTGDMRCCICSDGTCSSAGAVCSAEKSPQTNVELDVVPVVLSPVIVNLFGANKTGLNDQQLKEAEDKVKNMILQKTLNESTIIKDILKKTFPRLSISEKHDKTVMNISSKNLKPLLI